MKFPTFALYSAFTLCAVPAMAAELVDATDPVRILNIARGFGSADLEKDSGGDPKIVGRIDGTRYHIYFYGCTNNKKCSSIQFRSAWLGKNRYTQSQMNEWNRTKRFASAYLDSDNDPVFELDMNLDYGVSPRNLEDSFSLWSSGLRSFVKNVLDKN